LPSLIAGRTLFLIVAVLLQILLSLLLVWLTRRLGLESGLTPRAASLAALLVALSPNLVFLSTKLVTETLFTLLLVATALLVNRYRLSGRCLELAAAGVCSGLLILTRPIATYFPILLAGYVLFLKLRAGNGRSAVIHSALVLACASAVVSPWVIRNGRLTGRYVVSTVSDHNIYLYTGALTLAADKGLPLAEARDSMMAQARRDYGPLDSTDEGSYWSALARVGWKQTLARPLLALKLHVVGSAASCLMPISIRPLLVYAGADPTAGPESNPHVAQQFMGLLARGRAGAALGLAWQTRLAQMPILALIILLLALLFNTGLLILGLIGLLFKQSRGLLWLLLPVLYFILFVGPVGEARFRAPIEPLLCLFAAVALTRQRRNDLPIGARSA
jgi:hypothetical protein